MAGQDRQDPGRDGLTANAPPACARTAEPALCDVGAKTGAAMNDEAIARRWQQVVDGVRSRGLSDEVRDLEALYPLAVDRNLQGEIARLLGFYWLRSGQHGLALRWNDLASERLPQSADAAYNVSYSLFMLRRWDDAAARLRRALREHGEDFKWHNLLSTVLGLAGRRDEARVHGTRSLELKDALTAGVPGRDLSTCPVPLFDPTQPAHNVISFSLWGNQPKYLDGAVANAAAAAFIYPRWTCRFHVDASVPSDTLRALTARGAQVVQVQGLPAEGWGTLWRFLVADDPAVDRYLVRDADSLLNLREAAAVQEWLDSGRHFHAMRDHFDHSELVLAGMWGGVRAALPPLQVAARGFLGTGNHIPNRTADQEFLRTVLWPTIRKSLLVHDSQFSFGSRRDFPAFARLPPGCHVGGQAAELLGSHRVPQKPPPGPS
jgi:tetratricopeptide (TPR) repeat protein